MPEIQTSVLCALLPVSTLEKMDNTPLFIGPISYQIEKPANFLGQPLCRNVSGNFF